MEDDVLRDDPEFGQLGKISYILMQLVRVTASIFSNHRYTHSRSDLAKLLFFSSLQASKFFTKLHGYMYISNWR